MEPFRLRAGARQHARQRRAAQQRHALRRLQPGLKETLPLRRERELRASGRDAQAKRLHALRKGLAPRGQGRGMEREAHFRLPFALHRQPRLAAAGGIDNKRLLFQRPAAGAGPGLGPEHGGGRDVVRAQKAVFHTRPQQRVVQRKPPQKGFQGCVF